MASIDRVLIPICRLAAETTLSEGAIVIIVDQDRTGMSIIVGYTTLNDLRDGDEHVYSEAIEHCLAGCEMRYGVSKIITARFRESPRSLNGITMVHSRHAIIIYWDKGVWVYTKSGPAIQLELVGNNTFAG